jgi:hypothetical protein
VPAHRRTRTLDKEKGMHKQSGVATILASLLLGCANQPSGPGERLDLGQDLSAAC